MAERRVRVSEIGLTKDTKQIETSEDIQGAVRRKIKRTLRAGRYQHLFRTDNGVGYLTMDERGSVWTTVREDLDLEKLIFEVMQEFGFNPAIYRQGYSELPGHFSEFLNRFSYRGDRGLIFDCYITGGYGMSGRHRTWDVHR